MKPIVKTSLVAGAVAVISSVATFFVLGNTTAGKTEFPLFTESGSLHRVVAADVEKIPDFVSAAESTVNGVVSIKSYSTQTASYTSPFSDPLFEYFFGGESQRRKQQQQKEPEQRQTGLGSGVIISEDGYIVTNNHVIEDADRLEVTLNDNRTFNATVIGSDENTDLALIKIDAEKLHVIPIGDSDSIKVGEWILGFTSTVTKGIVSAKARNISSLTQMRSNGIQSYIQTDAAVNPGNSGGALVNLAGELIGINTAIYSQTGSFTGYSFAIPTSIVKKVITDLKQYGVVQRAILGISFRELTSDLAREKGVTAISGGLYVAGVEQRSGAMEAGLKEGDVIVSIDDTQTINTAQLQEAIAKHSPGDKVTITYYRDNKKHTAQVTLRNSLGNTDVTRSGSVLELGCTLETASEETLSQIGISNGVQVKELKDGKFKEAGVKEGFIIVEINNSRVSSADDVERIYKAIMQSGPEYDKVMFITGFYPTGRKFYYAVDLAQ